MPIHPVVKKSIRIIVITLVVLGIIFMVLKVTYTDVPPERLAVTEMVGLAAAARTPIAETFADRGTLEGMTGSLLPPVQSPDANSKGPFEWTLATDGTLIGRSTRWQVEVVFRTADQGLNWTCTVTPPEHAPSVGPCAVAR